MMTCSSQSQLDFCVTKSTSSKKRKHDHGTESTIKMRVGNRDLIWGKHLKPMPEDASQAYAKGDYGTVKYLLDRDGYILIRNVFTPSTVLSARRTILQHLYQKHALAAKDEEEMMDAKIAKDDDGNLLDGWTVDAESGGVVGGREDDTSVDGWYNVGNSRSLLDVYAGTQLKTMYNNIFNATYKRHEKLDINTSSHTFLSTSLTPIALPDCTWLRMKGRGEVTAEHADYYYFRNHTDIFRSFWQWSRGEEPLQEPSIHTCSICSESTGSLLHCTLCHIYTHAKCLSRGVTRITPPEGEWHCETCANQDMTYYTCWTPLGTVASDDGSLCVIPGSHRLHGYHKPSRPDLLPADYTKSYESKSIWYTAPHMVPGDIILFNIKTVHAATRNQSMKFRLSCDTRVVVSPHTHTNVTRARDTPVTGEKPRKKLGMSMMTSRPKGGMMGMMGMASCSTQEDEDKPNKRVRQSM